MQARNCLYILFQTASLLLFEPASAGGLDFLRPERTGGPWESDQPGFHTDITYPVLYTLTLQGASVGFISSLDHKTTGYSGPSTSNFENAFRKGPAWDHDEWYWDYVAHPLAGSEIYLRARAQGCTPAGSLLFAACASTVWEFGVESWYERPSSQDLIVTPLAGAVIGEARFRIKRALIERDTRLSRTLAVVVDPVQSLAEMVGDTFGQDWREPAFRKSPLSAGHFHPVFMTGLSSDAKGSFAFSVQCSVAF